jgi:hypothetical protein
MVEVGKSIIYFVLESERKNMLPTTSNLLHTL